MGPCARVTCMVVGINYLGALRIGDAGGAVCGDGVPTVILAGCSPKLPNAQCRRARGVGD